MSSLSARLLLAVSLLLLVFFGATIVVLDIAFQKAGEQAQEDILDGQLMALLAAAEPNAAGELEMPIDLPEPRLGTIGSGLYAVLLDNDGSAVWKSRSLLGLEIPFNAAPEPGVHSFSRLKLADDTPLMALSLSVEWELTNGELRPYSFNVAESLDSFYAQVALFRSQLFGWFAAVAVIMLLAISLLMRGILKPLRQIEEEIGEIELGKREALTEGLPTELDSVARNMNLLIASERGRSERYRHTLDNLAHSLKTPLAAIRALLSEQLATTFTDKVDTQVERMNDIVRYQLRKPASFASDSFGLARVNIEEQLNKLIDGLGKVYKDKSPLISLSVDVGAEYRGDSGDFLELSGNLLDNALRHSKLATGIERARITVGQDFTSHRCLLSIIDLGAGVAPADQGKLFEPFFTTVPEGSGMGLYLLRACSS